MPCGGTARRCGCQRYLLPAGRVAQGPCHREAATSRMGRNTHVMDHSRRPRQSVAYCAGLVGASRAAIGQMSRMGSMLEGYGARNSKLIN